MTVSLACLTVAEDITERKQAEVERTELSRRLMTAQEAERRRIARELHDGIGQSLALLGIQLQRAGQPSVVGQEDPGVAELCTKVKEIGTQVSRLVAPVAFVGVGVSRTAGGRQGIVPRIFRAVSGEDRLHLQGYSRANWTTMSLFACYALCRRRFTTSRSTAARPSVMVQHQRDSEMLALDLVTMASASM